MCFAVKHCGLRISTWTYKKLVDRNGEDLIDRCVCLHKKLMEDQESPQQLSVGKCYSKIV